MQVKFNEEKLSKLDVEYKKAMVEINDLKKHITTLMGEIASPNQSMSDPMVKRLRKCLDEKEDQLAECIQNVNALTDTNVFLNEKIQYAEKQIKMLSEKTMDLHDDIDRLKLELEDREKVINYMNGANKELEELVKELRSAHPDRRVFESSFDLMNSSTSNNTSEFLIILFSSSDSFQNGTRIISEFKISPFRSQVSHIRPKRIWPMP